MALASLKHLNKKQQTNTGKHIHKSYIFLVSLIIIFMMNDYLDHSLTVDLETNSQPTYNVIKITPGSFHQGNVEKFFETAGLQCGINSIVSMCFTMVKKSVPGILVIWIIY